MKIVVDTNIFFSALLAEKNRYAQFLMDGTSGHTFYMPKFALVELYKYKEKILRFSRLSEDELLEVYYTLLKRINLFDEEAIGVETLERAYELVREVDEKDLLFVALTLEIDGSLWTGDEKLRGGLEVKGFQKFFEI